jgi:hypothetical protein
MESNYTQTHLQNKLTDCRKVKEEIYAYVKRELVHISINYDGISTVDNT